MLSIFKKYRDLMQHRHGWEVELKCPRCNRSGVPRFDGWKPNNTIKFGNKSTIFALLQCTHCGCELREEAGKKLIELFSEITIPPWNKHLIIWFVVAGMTMLAAVYFGKPAIGDWAYAAFIFFPALIMVFNYRVASIRSRCACGNPKYAFMGLLGRTYCYRCSSCGRLLRLRD